MSWHFRTSNLILKKNIAYLLQILKLERGRLLNARKIFKKQIGVLGVAVLITAQTPAMAAEESQVQQEETAVVQEVETEQSDLVESIPEAESESAETLSEIELQAEELETEISEAE